jgi:hypothetical protein
MRLKLPPKTAWRIWKARVFLGVSLTFCGLCAPDLFAAEEMSWLDNGTIRAGVHLRMGGSITSLSAHADGRELINNFDLGRQVQMSFYGGPVPFSPGGKQPHPAWKKLGWNPVQSGDWAGNPSRVLEHRHEGGELYTRVLPMQWALEGVESECELESWIQLDGPTVLMRCRMTNKRSDRQFQPARHQEIPAVYTSGLFKRVVTYAGPAPFTRGPLSEWVDPGPPWKSFSATENWAALVDAKGWGLGLWQPATTFWKCGHVPGDPGKVDSKDNATGYLSPIALEHMDHNIVYEYTCRLMVGSVGDMRRRVEAWSKPGQLPVYRFRTGRDGWNQRGGVDGGFPWAGGWKIEAQSNLVWLEGPSIFWDAEKATAVRFRGGVLGKAGRIRLGWKPFRAEDPEASTVFPIPPFEEGGEQVFSLKDQPAYRGGMQRLSLKFEGVKPGERIQVESIELVP